MRKIWRVDDTLREPHNQRPTTMKMAETEMCIVSDQTMGPSLNPPSSSIPLSTYLSYSVCRRTSGDTSKSHQKIRS